MKRARRWYVHQMQLLIARHMSLRHQAWSLVCSHSAYLKGCFSCRGIAVFFVAWLGDCTSQSFQAKDHLAKSLATMFLMKEGGSVPSAQSALNIFQTVLQKHFEADPSLLNQLIQLPQTTLAEKIAGLAPNFTEIVGAAHPNLAYFTDPNSDVFGDLTSFLTKVRAERKEEGECKCKTCKAFKQRVGATERDHWGQHIRPGLHQ